MASALSVAEKWMMKKSGILGIVLLVLFANIAAGQTRESNVRNDRRTVEAAGLWIYNDLPRARAEAKRSGRPMLVVFR